MSATLPPIEELAEPSKTSLTKSKPSLIQVKSSKSHSNQKVNGVLNQSTIINHVKYANITLIEDCFGIYHDRTGKPTKIPRFTWRSGGGVQVQVITYGARIVSIKTPDTRGIVDDIALGFGDLAGYIHYKDLFFGAIVGRVTHKIKNGTFQLDDKQYQVSCNAGTDHADGGFNGLDKMIWQACVKDTKVVLSCTLPEKHENFPGSLMVQVTYELSPENDFRISMEARTTKSTVINLSNLCYFNLGGHYGGPDQLHRHSVVINANCYTPMDEENNPTGEIMNVVNTKYDFLTPKLMKDYLEVAPEDGFDQNLCINRGLGQRSCFVARIVHVVNGRVLEVYSDQYGVRFDTANNWGTGAVAPSVLSPEVSVERSFAYEGVSFFILLNEMHEKMQAIQSYDEKNFKEVLELLKKINKVNAESRQKSDMSSKISAKLSHVNPDFNVLAFISVVATSISQVTNAIPRNVNDITDWAELKVVVDDLLEKYHEQDVIGDDDSTVEEVLDQLLVPIVGERSHDLKKSKETLNKSSQSLKDKWEQFVSDNNVQVYDANVKNEGILSKVSIKMAPSGEINSKTSPQSTEMFNCKLAQSSNVIPALYKDGRIHGKNNAIYRRHGAMALQTQNYPDSMHHEAFPSSILKPGQTYRHNIVYKFWVQENGLNKLKTKRKC